MLVLWIGAAMTPVALAVAVFDRQRRPECLKALGLIGFGCLLAYLFTPPNVPMASRSAPAKFSPQGEVKLTIADPAIGTIERGQKFYLDLTKIEDPPISR